MSSSSILTMMNNISKNIQRVFEEIVKLLIRKNITPSVNPNGSRNLVYNNFLQRYERANIGTLYDDSVDIYNYFMTFESIGWNNDVFANFKLIPKFNRNISNIRRQKQKKQKIPFIDQNQTRNCKYNNLNQTRHSTGKKKRMLHTGNIYKSVIDIIINKKITSGYSSDILYPLTFKDLEIIGRDIIVQTDSSINNSDSSKMSTAVLRNKLQLLEQNLLNFSIDNSNLYDSYINMIRIINSLNRDKITRLINLIALLSVQKWEDVAVPQQHIYINFFGESFINELVDNDLFNIISSSSSFELVLTTSYLYPLLKILFSVFGYSKIVPDSNSLNPTLFNPMNNELSVNIISGTVDNINVYNYIRIFGGLYPTIISLMGGTETFPSIFPETRCITIPKNYFNLVNIPEYLWRFNNYSYCVYKNYSNSKQLVMSLCAKKNNRVKYLYTI